LFLVFELLRKEELELKGFGAVVELRALEQNIDSRKREKI